MGFMKAPDPVTPPAAPTVESAATDDDIKARGDARKKAMGAVNSRTSILQQNSGSSANKTLLGA